MTSPRFAGVRRFAGAAVAAIAVAALSPVSFAQSRPPKLDYTMTTLPNGENAHCTVRPSEWWNAVFAKAAEAKPGVAWTLVVESR